MYPEVARLFSKWAMTGRADRMARQHRPRGEMALARIPLLQGDRCLDLGCGEGWASRWLAEAIGPDGAVFGVDISSEMLDSARTRGRRNLRYERTTFDDLPWTTGSFDHGFSMEALYYSDPVAALAEVARVIRPGGTFTAAMDYYTENPSSHGWPEELGLSMILLSTEAWKQLFEDAGFEVVDCFQCVDGEPPGTLAIRGTRR